MLKYVITNIKGFKIKGLQYKLQSFADDVMIILGQRSNSIIPLCQLSQDYGQLSGLKINTQNLHILTKIGLIYKP